MSDAALASRTSPGRVPRDGRRNRLRIELELPADSDTYLLRLPIGRAGRAAADKVAQHFRERVEPASATAPTGRS